MARSRSPSSVRHQSFCIGIGKQLKPGLPGKKVWKMIFFPGQGILYESGKLRKNGKSQGKVREFQSFPLNVMVKTVF